MDTSAHCVPGRAALALLARAIEAGAMLLVKKRAPLPKVL